MTLAAVVVNALLLTLLQFDGAHDWADIPWPAKVDGWKNGLYQLGKVIAQGTSAALVTIMALNMNFMPPGSKNWRWRALLSSFGVLLLNGGVITQLDVSLKSIFTEDEKRSWDSDSAHLLLLLSSVFITLILDYYHVRLFGCCECGCCSCCCSSRVPTVLRSQDPSLEGDGHKKTSEHESGVHTGDRAPGTVVMQYNLGAGESMGSAPHSGYAGDKPGAEIHISAGVEQGGRSDPQGPISGHVPGEALPSTQPRAQASVESKMMMKRWDTRVLVERWESHVETKAKPKLERKKAKVGKDQATGLASLLRPVHMWRALARHLRRSWNAVKEEQGRFRYSVWVKVAVVTSLLLQVYFCIKTVEFWYEAVGKWKTFKFSVDTALDNVSGVVSDFSSVIDQRIAAAGGIVGASGSIISSELNSTADSIMVAADETPGDGLQAVSVGGMVFFFRGGTIESIFRYVTTLLPKLQVVIFIGYPLALPIGFWTVYVVLAQHKRLFLCLESEVELQQGGSSEDHSPARETWLGIERRYPIGGAVFFFGVLTSTAVIQIQIFGFLLSLVLGILANLANFDVLMDAIGPWLMALLGALLLNRLAIVLLGNMLLSDGLRIARPFWFFIYMFVFSMVHLVLGIFHAVVRIVMLVLTTLLILNRLDFTPFAALKQFDGGHNAFMCMLILAQVIQKDKQALKGDSGRKDIGSEEDSGVSAEAGALDGEGKGQSSRNDTTRASSRQRQPV
eukprot:evm.model.scf_1528.2 EVM.evm.TU.scf_1528.2   scf_1528:18239-21474(+)